MRGAAERGVEVVLQVDAPDELGGALHLLLAHAAHVVADEPEEVGGQGAQVGLATARLGLTVPLHDGAQEGLAKLEQGKPH